MLPGATAGAESLGFGCGRSAHAFALSARARNVGWRIDYFVVNQEAAERLESVKHQPEQKGSDHCPVVLTLRK